MIDPVPPPWSYEVSWAEDEATGKARPTRHHAITSGGDVYVVATCWGHWLPSRLVARRIVACVNACAGVATEELEARTASMTHPPPGDEEA